MVIEKCIGPLMSLGSAIDVTYVHTITTIEATPISFVFIALQHM